MSGETPSRAHQRVSAEVAPVERGSRGLARANDHAQIQSVTATAGQPIDPATRAPFESRFGEDFSHVRVHADRAAADSAAAMQAKAYTAGPHVVFGRGRYAPHAPEGRQLLAHELAHVVQQSRASGSEVGYESAEREAEAAGQLANGTAAIRVSVAHPPGAVQCAPDSPQPAPPGAGAGKVVRRVFVDTQLVQFVAQGSHPEAEKVLQQLRREGHQLFIAHQTYEELFFIPSDFTDEEIQKQTDPARKTALVEARARIEAEFALKRAKLAELGSEARPGGAATTGTSGNPAEARERRADVYAKNLQPIDAETKRLLTEGEKWPKGSRPDAETKRRLRKGEEGAYPKGSPKAILSEPDPLHPGLSKQDVKANRDRNDILVAAQVAAADGELLTLDTNILKRDKEEVKRGDAVEQRGALQRKIGLRIAPESWELSPSPKPGPAGPGGPATPPAAPKPASSGAGAGTPPSTATPAGSAKPPSAPPARAPAPPAPASSTPSRPSPAPSTTAPPQAAPPAGTGPRPGAPQRPQGPSPPVGAQGQRVYTGRPPADRPLAVPASTQAAGRQAAGMAIGMAMEKLAEIAKSVQETDARTAIATVRREIIETLRKEPREGAIIEVQFVEPQHQFFSVGWRRSSDPDANKRTTVHIAGPQPQSTFIYIDPVGSSAEPAASPTAAAPIEVKSVTEFVSAYLLARGADLAESDNVIVGMYDAIQRGQHPRFGVTDVAVGGAVIRVPDHARESIEATLGGQADKAIARRLRRLQGGINTQQVRLKEKTGSWFGGAVRLTGHELDPAHAHNAAAANYARDRKFGPALQSIDAGDAQVEEVWAMLYEYDYGHRPHVPLMW